MVAALHDEEIVGDGKLGRPLRGGPQVVHGASEVSTFKCSMGGSAVFAKTPKNPQGQQGNARKKNNPRVLSPNSQDENSMNEFPSQYGEEQHGNCHETHSTDDMPVGTVDACPESTENPAGNGKYNQGD